MSITESINNWKSYFTSSKKSNSKRAELEKELSALDETTRKEILAMIESFEAGLRKDEIKVELVDSNTFRVNIKSLRDSAVVQKQIAAASKTLNSAT
ncbi:hypothetical protein ABMY44_04755 [Pseudoalteromonas sp. Cnat2-41]|uniref:hypothetical protein n=1 Tax=unclassified Pseudoalteromonas TaxID=194690 RepID=UPI001EF94E7E|nr:MULTISPECIES: hypothetical protein [unclassified Pseudoalteromonas]MCF2861466.1 hypothetical protein [Pseudoalteromonas sp. CNAT2-18]MCG7557495.1 hypothetical protein [Pseudoalteromonas sp. CNAT2-18.1]